MAMLVISLVLGALAVTRVTRLLVDDRLTLRYRVWVRTKWGEDSLPAYFVDCPWCTSIWVSALVMPGAVLYPNQWVIAALAIPAMSMVAGLVLDRE
jgi:hypothetical protein